MKCKEAYLRICDDLSADPRSPKCREVLKHLEACPDCSALLDSVQKTVSLYKLAPGPEVSPAVHKRLAKIVDFAWKSGSPPSRSAK